MFDLIEGAKVVWGITATTASAVKVTGDYVNMENMHRIWAVCQWAGGSTAPSVTFKVASDYTGTGSSTAATAKWWLQKASTASPLDRMTRSTATSCVAKAEMGVATTAYVIVGMLDPASAPSSKQYLAVEMGIAEGIRSATYICEPRYKGSQQFIATTSST